MTTPLEVGRPVSSLSLLRRGERERIVARASHALALLGHDATHRLGHFDMRAQAVVPSALKIDTRPTVRRLAGWAELRT